MQKAEATMEKHDSLSLGLEGNKAGLHSAHKYHRLISAPDYHGFATFISDGTMMSSSSGLVIVKGEKQTLPGCSWFPTKPFTAAG